MKWYDTFGVFEKQSPKGKEWLNTLSNMQLCAICVIGRALESVNIPYIIANLKDVKKLDHYSQFIDEFYPYIGIKNLNTYFENMLFYFNVESGNDNKSDDMSTYYYDNGDKYVGQFKNDKKEGTGTLYNFEGMIIYDGEWSDDDMDGMGSLTPPDVDEYVGQSSIFDGEWPNNEEDVDIHLLSDSKLRALIASEIGGNSDEIPKSSAKFGYDIYNPIPVAGIESNKVYLSRLITDKNEKITWDRVGSYNLKGMQGCIDKYNIYLESTKQNLCSLFINPYNKKTSSKAPEGFKIVS